MQACGGVAVAGFLQQPILIKASSFPYEGFNLNGFPDQLKLNSVNPLQLSFNRGSLIIARAAPSVTLPVPELEGQLLVLQGSFCCYNLCCCFIQFFLKISVLCPPTGQ